MRPSSYFKRSVFAGALLLVLAAPAFAQAAIESPAIDPDLFRPGEVLRTQSDYGRWQIVCDEVKKLKQKFCSLRTFGFDGERPVVSMVVSTGDNGRPAALITLPFGITLGHKVQMSSAGIKGRALPVTLDFNPVLCARDGCKIVWSLTANDITSLRNGVDLQLRFLLAAHQGDQGDPYARQKQAVMVNARIFGAGFNEAVLDSTK